MELTDFIDRLGGAERDGNGLLAHCPCPSHPDNNPSLRISVSTAGKVLVKCRARCETKDVMAAVGLTMRDLGQMRPGDAPVSAVPDSTGPVDVAARARLGRDLDDFAAALAEADEAHPAVAYAARRFGLTLADVRRLGLGYAAEGDLDPWARLVVPFRDPAGIPGGYQARALDPRADLRWRGPANPAGGGTWAKIGWLPAADDQQHPEVVVTEGPGDALTAVAAGYDAILIRGAALASNAAVLDDVRDMLDGRPAVVAGDGDDAGRRFNNAVTSGLVERDVCARVLKVPDGMDLADWYVEAGLATVAEALAEASPAERHAATPRREQFPLTDVGNAEFLRATLRAKGSDVRYVPGIGYFLLSNGIWESVGQSDDGAIRRAAHNAARTTYDRARAIAEGLGDNPTPAARATARKWETWGVYTESNTGLTAALAELRALDEVCVAPDALDQHPDLLAVRNGVVDLRTGALLPHDPGLLLTRRIDHDYRPEAVAPRWEQFLREVFPAHPDMPAFMQRLVGYGITGHTTEQCFAVLWGRGANGKSVFTDTLTEVFREQTVTTPFSTFEVKPSGGVPNDLAALKGARLVMASEGEQGRPMAEAVLKRVTGRDVIVARFMRKEYFEFRPTFLLMLATNFKPNFKGQDEGLWRRVKMIPWQRYFAPDERDPHLGEKLREEAEGILAWAVRGAQEWYAHGLAEPAVVREATTHLRDTSDPLAGFFPGWLVPAEGARVRAQQVYEAYLDYCDEEHVRESERKAPRALYAALEERDVDYRRHRKKSGWFYGVRVTEPAERAAAERDDDDGDAPTAAAPPTLPMSSDDFPSLEGL